MYKDVRPDDSDEQAFEYISSMIDRKYYYTFINKYASPDMQ